MESKRAQEILFNTNGNIEVKYNNSPVWIEGVDLESGSVLVKNLSNNKMMEVNSGKLDETGKVSPM